MNVDCAGRYSRPTPDLSFVCCVEFGRLEEQTVLMVRSLRAFGGAFANAPVFAVVGRSGAPLRRQTREELARLRVSVLHADRSDNPAPWLNYANKIAAVLTAERLAETPQIAWLDSDIFFLAEPAGLRLQDSEDLAIRSHFLPPAVLQGDDRHVDYWTRICNLFGVDFDDVPWIEGTEGYPRQKISCNSGVFTWRRGSGFAQRYADGVRRILSARIAQRSGEFFTVDQVVFTPLIVRDDVPWRNLSVSDHTLSMSGFLTRSSSNSPSLSEARLLHYSNSFAPESRELMQWKLQREVPGFWTWLQEQRLDLGPAHRFSRAVAGVLRALRGLHYRVYARSTVRAD